MQFMINAWIDNRSCALVIRLASLTNRATAPTVEALQALGFTELLVHGVSRPQRTSEIETLFVFASPGQTDSAAHVGGLELMMPHLHSTYLRVQSTERELSQVPPPPSASGNGYAGASISEREEQVLGWVREGMSNQEIGLQLGISPLTVKNHVQKILRKLGATNRAQAVARAMSMNLLVNPANGKEPSAK
jgi:DNA-binding CsgD family transcriptional regulator